MLGLCPEGSDEIPHINSEVVEGIGQYAGDHFLIGFGRSANEGRLTTFFPDRDETPTDYLQGLFRLMSTPHFNFSNLRTGVRQEIYNQVNRVIVNHNDPIRYALLESLVRNYSQTLTGNILRVVGQLRAASAGSVTIDTQVQFLVDLLTQAHAHDPDHYLEIYDNVRSLAVGDRNLAEVVEATLQQVMDL